MRRLRWIHLRQVRLQGQHPEGLVRAAPEPGNPDGSCPAHRTLQAQVKYDNVTWLLGYRLRVEQGLELHTFV